MRQVMFNSSKAFVARMPRPSVDAGTVLVRTSFSLISAGTELATLRPVLAKDAETPAQRIGEAAQRAQYYLGKAVTNPRLALDRVVQLARNSVERATAPAAGPAPVPQSVRIGPIAWTQQAATASEARDDGSLKLTSGGDPGHYQAASQPMKVPAGTLVEVTLKGRVEQGGFIVGLLNEDKSTWLGMIPLPSGSLDETLHFDPGSASEVTLMLTNGSAPGENRIHLTSSRVTMVGRESAAGPVTEMTDQGWNVGYSLAGTVIAIGEGVTEFAIGDLVACAGAGQANHADFVCVKKNLVCRVPDGCSLQEAATATVGSIAMQGVRRAAPQLGEVVCVIGLGLIGLITVQLLRAAGCRVVGLDLDEERCKRAVALGATAAESNVERVSKLLAKLTAGQGADVTLVTAATKSDAPLNSAMELTRRRGRVVIVGDIGMRIERAAFYRKEIDLLMSTSYGPGRYDREYEDFGRDYPPAYVRWTANRNMQSYLELIAEKRIDIASLIDQVYSVDEAPEAYVALARAKGSPPVGVLISYPDNVRSIVDAADSPVVHLRGSRPARRDVLNYALVGAGGFGTQMLVPMMDRRKDRFFLRAVVSRDAVRGGNFARSRQVEILSSSYDEILKNPEIDLVVLATRHNEHAEQILRALEAGKHVFVEKPLATTWDQLDALRDSLSRPGAPSVMVGFNRRFAPPLQLAAKQFANHRSPLMVNYRMNAGYIPLDHWVHTFEGGGRNIGEACHVYDCFAFLTGSSVSSVAATSINPGKQPFLRNDNFSATLGYADGSVCTLTYTALGPKSGLPKERIEIFADGECWIVDDFKTLTRASDQAVLWSESNADKGHAEELSRFGDCLAEGKPAPIPLASILETTATALHIEDLLMGRAGAQ